MSTDRSMPPKRWYVPLFVALLGACVMFLAGAGTAYRAGLAQAEVEAQTALLAASDRLLGQLDRYRQIPSVLSERPDVQGAFGQPGEVERNSRLLQRIADKTGANEIYLMDADGMTFAASGWEGEQSFVGKNFAFRPYFKRAATGALGFYHAVGTTSLIRGFYFAHPVRRAGGGIKGVVAVKVDLEAFETNWRSDPDSIFFTDQNGVVFLGNRSELLLRRLDGATGELGVQYANLELEAFPDTRRTRIFGTEIWSNIALGSVPARVLHGAEDLPIVEMKAHILRDLSGVERQALLWGMLATALYSLVGMGFLIVLQRRAAMAAQLETEARANAELEGRVARRTAALEAEVEERSRAEAALRKAQDDLVQAGKLSALGQMSAGISHELNQPLAAIQSYAETGQAYFLRGQPDVAVSNLKQIAEVSGRMGRIIRNLRAFARKEGEAARNVDMVAVVADALAILDGPVRRSGVTLNWQAPDQAVWVSGGAVRLQQVVVNLVTNAMDAMEGQDRPMQIDMWLEERAEGAALFVRDSGPGLEDPEKMFDPFYTTKTVGNGLGLGLSISYGIVQSFGGVIRGENVEGGAVFTVELSAPEEEVKAAQ